MEFQERYGPWALIAGASEGVGAEFARRFAGLGLHLVLVSRRQAVLDELAASISADTGVETHTVAVDLSESDAMDRLRDATAGLDVGMVVYCAGADAVYEPFLDQPVDNALAMIQRNCVVPMQIAHAFAGPMVERGRGGLIFCSSGAGLGGGKNMVAYGATKAFDIVMSESLWAEVHDAGVDVLSLVLSVTDTPALRRIMVKWGVLASPDDDIPIAGVTSPEQVVTEALEHLRDGPTWFASEHLRAHEREFATMSRSERVRAVVARQGATFSNPTAHTDSTK